MKKIVFGAVVALALVAGAVAVPANAQTTAELQAQISALLAQISALQAQAGSVSATFTRDLTVGSTGADVTALQTKLNVSPATGYFGPITKSAVIAYQLSKGITPASGYVGPITRTALNAGTPSTPSTPGTTTGSLEGTDGSIASVNNLSQYSNEEVSDGSSDVKVLGMEVKASKDGDVGLKSMKISFAGTGTGSTRIADYINSISIWDGSTRIATADTSDFNKDSTGNYSKTVTLDSGVVVNSNTTSKIYITVDAVSNLDSGDLTKNWTIDVDNIRYVDGSGVVTTDTQSNGQNVAMDFVSYSTAADTELKISTNSTETPVAGIVIVSTTKTTDDVSLLKGKMKLDGTSDAVINEIPVTFTVTSSGTANGVDDIAPSVTLRLGGETYTKSIPTAMKSALTGSVTFDNLDFAVSAGETVDFEVLADINDIDGTIFTAGDTITASLTTSNREMIDVENGEGDQLATGEKTGTATGKTQTLRASGINLALVGTPSTSVTAGTSSNDDLGTFTIKFRVTAIGDDIYVSSLADAKLSGVTAGKTSVHVDRAGTATVGGVSTVITNTTDTTLTSVGNYLIEDGQTETFELTTTVQLPTAGTAGLFRAALGGVSWSTTDVAAPANAYTTNLDAFKTSYVGLN